jgi:hypothetical protein
VWVGEWGGWVQGPCRGRGALAAGSRSGSRQGWRQRWPGDRETAPALGAAHPLQLGPQLGAGQGQQRPRAQPEAGVAVQRVHGRQVVAVLVRQRLVGAAEPGQPWAVGPVAGARVRPDHHVGPVRDGVQLVREVRVQVVGRAGAGAVVAREHQHHAAPPAVRQAGAQEVLRVQVGAVGQGAREPRRVVGSQRLRGKGGGGGGGWKRGGEGAQVEWLWSVVAQACSARGKARLFKGAEDCRPRGRARAPPWPAPSGTSDRQQAGLLAALLWLPPPAGVFAVRCGEGRAAAAADRPQMITDRKISVLSRACPGGTVPV